MFSGRGNRFHLARQVEFAPKGLGPWGRSQKGLEKVMKVRPSVKKLCPKCKIIRRHGVLRVICENPRHKQRQG